MLFSRESLAFVLGTCILIGFGLSACALGGFDDEDGRLFRAFAVTLTIVVWLYLAFLRMTAETHISLSTFFWTSAIVFPLGVLVLLHSRLDVAIFWLDVALWTAVSIAAAGENADVSRKWDSVLSWFTLGWFSITSHLSAASLPWSPFSAGLSSHLSWLHGVIDVRLILTLTLFSLIVATGFIRALRLPFPSATGLPPWKIPLPHGTGPLEEFFRVILQALNGMLVVPNMLSSLIWIGLQILGIFFGRMGQQIAGITRHLVLEQVAWGVAVRTIAVPIIIVAVFSVAASAQPAIETYLHLHWFERPLILVRLASLAATELALIWLVAPMLARPDTWSAYFKEFNASANASVVGLAWLLASSLVAGTVLSLLHTFSLGDALEYGGFGVLSAALFLLMLGGAVAQLGSSPK